MSTLNHKCKRDMANITFNKLDEQEYARLRADVKGIFSIAVIETFGNQVGQEEIIPDDDIDHSLYDPQCETLAVYADGEKVGGVVVKIDSQTGISWLELFYVYPDKHGRGLGLRIWQSLEKKISRYQRSGVDHALFEKRNIHFYVNKCGFKIVEFFNEAHRDPSRPSGGSDFHDEYFIFEKVME